MCHSTSPKSLQEFDIDTFTLYMYVVLHVHHLESFESYKKYVYKSRRRAPWRRRHSSATAAGAGIRGRRLMSARKIEIYDALNVQWQDLHLLVHVKCP